MNISTQPNVRSVLDQVYVDFTTGKRLSSYTPPPAADRTDALRRFLAVAEQYLPQLEPGWWTFPDSQQIPEDLLLPFRDFVAKYNLTAGVPQIFSTTGFGTYDLMDSLTLWVMRSFNVDMVRTLLGINAGFVPASRRNQDLYDAILRFLGPDVLLSSSVIRGKRSDSGGVVLDVRDSVSGTTTRIVAKKLLFTAPPTDVNTAPFDLDATEKSTLAQFRYGAAYVGVVSHPSLPLNTSIVNMPSAAQPANWAAAVPVSPYNTRFENYPDSPYYRVIAVGDQTLSARQARQIISDAFDGMVAAGTLKQSEPPQPLKFHAFAPHDSMSAHASREDLEAGFISQLNGLQGQQSTWYTGSAWSVHISTSLWIFTETVLSKLVVSLS